MSFLLQVVLVLVAVSAEVASSRNLNSEESASSRRPIALDDILNDFLLSFTPRNTVIDVFVPPDCLKENIELFKVFLNSRTQTVTLWTDGEMHCSVCEEKPCAIYRYTFLHIVYLICGKYEIRNLAYGMLTHYFKNYFILVKNAEHPRGDRKLFKGLPFLSPYPRASGRFVFLFENGSLLLNGEFERDLVVHKNSSKAPWLEGQRAISGSSVQLHCKGSYACEHPSFNVTMEILTHLNASVEVTVNRPGGAILLSKSIDNLDTGFFYSDWKPLRHFASAGFSFYVRKRVRVPKETIFILPFSGEVWAGLLVSAILLVMTYVIIATCVFHQNANIFVFVFTMLAAFFQQSVQLHRSMLTKRSIWCLYGVMALMFFVMSTVFKGRLTSLLNDLPFQGEVTKFVSFQDIVRKGHRLCILENAGFVPKAELLDIYSFHLPISFGHRCFNTANSHLQKSRSIKIAADGRDTFFTGNSPTGPSEALRQELLGRGYVETEGTVFSYPVGPGMRASSAYRDDIDATLSNAIAAGLYVRSASLAEYKSRSFHESNPETQKGYILNLGDLRPFFLAWFVGVLISILAFIGELLRARVRSTTRVERVRVILKPRARGRLRLARSTKENTVASPRENN